MPIGFWVTIIVSAVLAVLFCTALAHAFLREEAEAKAAPMREWDVSARVELLMMRHAQEKDKKRCPGCGGTRCYDWVRNGRSCTEPPTLSPGVDSRSQGKHRHGLVKLVPDGWWPLPRTTMARLKPHLWEKVADHAQIVVTPQRVVALP